MMILDCGTYSGWQFDIVNEGGGPFVHVNNLQWFMALGKESDILELLLFKVLFPFHIWSFAHNLNSMETLSCFGLSRGHQIVTIFLQMPSCHSATYPDNKVHGANMGPIRGPVAPSWAPCWPHEPCYQGICSDHFVRHTTGIAMKEVTWLSYV